MSSTTSCIPVNIDFRTKSVKWIDLEHFHDLPFLDSRTISSLDQYTFKTGLEELHRREDEAPSHKPSGFIFHTSRCGSTLIAKLLQKGGNTLMLVEPQPVNALLVDFTGPEQDHVYGEILMRQLIAAYLNTGRKVFIKFSSFNILLIRQILKKWQDVPVLFLYRHPVEVVVSNLEKHGGFMRKRNAPQLKYMLEQWGVELSNNLTAEEYCVRMVNLFFHVMVDHMKHADRSNTILKDYDTIDLKSIKQVIQFFGFDLSEHEIAHGMTRDAKSGKIFNSDKAIKQARASKIVHRLCQDLALANYGILKAMNTNTF